MATPLFPVSISFGYPLEVRSAWNTLISPMGTGFEIRHQRQAFPKREIVPSFSWLSPAELNSLWAFYQARKGALESFHYVHKTSEAWYAEFIGIGDGAENTFDLPCLSTDPASLVVYANGVIVSDYLFSPLSGENDADQVIFYAPPANGVIITADFTGRHRFLVRFQKDNLTRSLVSLLCYQSEFVLQEVLSRETEIFGLEEGGLFGLEGS